MNARPESHKLALQWMRKAAHDLKAADQILLLPAKECPFDTVCFHAQQCAEKSLKAWLVFQGKNFERIHDLKLLLHLCARDRELTDQFREIEILSPYAIDARYPDEEGEEPITRFQAKEAIALAKKLYEEIRRRIPTG